MTISGCFQLFRLECEWSCALLYPLFPCVPVASVVGVVVIGQASPEYPARLDWCFYPRFSLQFPSVYDNITLWECNRKCNSLRKVR